MWFVDDVVARYTIAPTIRSGGSCSLYLSVEFESTDKFRIGAKQWRFDRPIKDIELPVIGQNINDYCTFISELPDRIDPKTLTNI